MKFLLLCAALFGALGWCANSAAADASSELLPTPKNFVVGSKLEYAPGITFSIADEVGLPAATRRWLVCDLAAATKWKPVESGSADLTVRLRPLANGRPEEYQLKLAEREITLSGADFSGVCRAIGRLLYVFESQLVERGVSGGLSTDALDIRDWPDFKIRCRQLPLKTGLSSRVIYGTLDAMARLGYNYVSLVVGGYYDSPKYPRAITEPRVSLAEIREVASYARARGLTPIPEINAIGHLATGPAICPIEPEPRGKGKRVGVMDISNPAFYPVFFGMIDELLEVCGHPPYIDINTDEFHLYNGVEILEKKFGKSGHEFYAEFLNRVNREMRRRQVKIIVAHDMLAAKSENLGGPANGERTAGALEKLDRDIVILYWDYSGAKVNFLKKLKKLGFREYWVMCWRGETEISRLCTAARADGAVAVFGGSWSFNPYNDGVPETAQFAWNTEGASRPPEFYEKFNDRYFYGWNPFASHSVGRALTVSGGVAPADFLMKKLAAANWHFPEARSFAATVSLASLGVAPDELVKGDVEKFKVAVAGCPEWCSISGVNRERGKMEILIYTPAFGSNTGTNRFGYEYSVVNGRVTAMTPTKTGGSMTIPPDGYVISMHKPGYFFNRFLKVGADVVICRIDRAGGKRLTYALNGVRNFTVYLTCALPVDRAKPLATLQIPGAGAAGQFKLTGRDLLEAPRRSDSLWQVAVARPADNAAGLSKIVAVTWRTPDTFAAPVKLVVDAASDGVASGLTVLGVRACN